MGAFAVVLETFFSGISELPFFTFVLLMLPIHLAIGVVEGLITAAVVTFVWKARPEILEMAPPARRRARPAPSSRSSSDWWPWPCSPAASSPGSPPPTRTAWSGPSRASPARRSLRRPRPGRTGCWPALQEKLAFLPDYDFRKPEGEKEAKKAESWPDVNPGKSLAGVLGAAITLLLVGAIGFGLKKYAAHQG